MLTTALLALPWIAIAFAVPLALRRGPHLRSYTPRDIEAFPRVSVIVPARNEVSNIGACVASLLDSRYARARRCDVIIVDDESTDGTREVAQALAERSDGALRVVRGEPLPDGWVGKPWACWQGVGHAEGELILFTDADTRHDPELLGHAVAALLRENVDLLTVIPRQIMGTFWERVIMPQILVLIFSRYLDAGRVNSPRKPQDVIANGQFILVRREAYEDVGGHEAVRNEIVEDLRLAQRFVEHRRPLFMAYAEDLLATRMYDSLAELGEGWTKNLAMGSRATVSGWLRPLLPWLLAALLLLLWVVPPYALLLGLLGVVTGTTLLWAA
ncbi:MAG: glycosyltransferase, partial [Longimicrobiales bacterium]